MKIKCKSLKSSNEKVYKWLTLNKLYDASDYDKKNFMIRDDSGEVALYPKKNFYNEVEIRNSSIDKILNQKP